MKYYGKIEKLIELGYRWNESLNCYEKYKSKSGVFIFKNRNIEYSGKDSKLLLKEIKVLKGD